MSAEPSPLGDGLRAVMRSLQDGPRGTITGVFAAWPEIVGPLIAEHATPRKIDGTTLFVDVDQPAWATQLRYLEANLLTALRAHGCVGLASISLRVGSGQQRQPGGGRRP
jgi:predicted nucleic acid-binding Zn ribbon protein